MAKKRIGYEVAIGASHGVNRFEAACGPGSFPENNKEYVNKLQAVLEDYGITSVSDYGCGNMQTYKSMDFWKNTNIDYKGYDLHIECIEECKKRYPHLKFDNVGIMQLPPSDQCLIIKDVLIHWFDQHIINFFKNVFEKFEYVIYMHSTTGQGYELKDHRHGAHRNYKYGQDDEYFYGNKTVPFEYLPKEKIIEMENIKGDSLKTFIVFKR